MSAAALNVLSTRKRRPKIAFINTFDSEKLQNI